MLLIAVTSIGQEFEKDYESTIQISASRNHMCVLKNAEVTCEQIEKSWLYNFSNEVPALVNPTKISSSGNRACAIDETGVVCWKTIDGPVSVWPYPLTLQNLMNPTDLSVGTNHTCVIDDSRVVCWGEGEYIQNIPKLINPSQISVGRDMACALDDTGVVCWGKTYLEGSYKTKVYRDSHPNLSNPSFINISTAGACAIHDSGVVCWDPQNGTRRVNKLAAMMKNTPDLSNPEYVAVNSESICVMDEANVKCWSEVGNSDTVPSLEEPSKLILADNKYGCALDNKGVTCWRNSYNNITTPFKSALAKRNKGSF